MTLDEIKNALVAAGLAVPIEQRLPSGLGTQLRFPTGEIVNVFDTGRWNLQGKNSERVRAILQGVVASSASGAAVVMELPETVTTVSGTAVNNAPPAADAEVELPPAYIAALDKHGFELVELLGMGASGRVFRAHQKTLGRSVAVKFFDNRIAARDKQAKLRFVREAKLLASVHSSHIPYVLTTGSVPFGDPSGTPYFIMQHLPGRQLATRLRQGPLDLSTAVDFTRQILLALGAAHKAKVIHRDVGPHNVLEDHGRVYLIDFSIGGRIDTPSATPLTMTNEHLGRPEYAAPEQQEDATKSTERSDIYSAGVLLFEMLLGHPRFVLDQLAKQLQGFPAEVVAAIRKAISPKPEDRFASAMDFHGALAGLSPQMLTKRSGPAKAGCLNVTCSLADWTPNGYYRGPRILEEASEPNCRGCGKPFLYDCRSCGAPFDGSQFCGMCGTQFYEDPPVCKACGSWLKKVDIGTDTSAGCGKCGRKTRSDGPPPEEFNDSYVPAEPGDDPDIPF